jgi:hypothetical protein
MGDLGQLLCSATYRIRWRSDNFALHCDTRQEIWAHYGDNASTPWYAVYGLQVESKSYFTFTLCLFLFSPSVGVAQAAAGYSSLYTPRTKKFPLRILKPCALSSLQRRMAKRERHTGWFITHLTWCKYNFYITYTIQSVTAFMPLSIHRCLTSERIGVKECDK